MKRSFLSISFLICCLINVEGQHVEVTFKSSDSAIENAFNWAKMTALSYKHDVGDPVGAWYEASLPGRFAFCMRDVSHQCIGAEILGMSKENKNMFTKFVKNISVEKDWCSYWEINKWNKPAPADYRNDKEFWYNLDANFDVLYATWRLYLWTGNKTYINSPAFLNFDEKTLNDYIKTWVLETDSLLTRPSHPNEHSPINENNPFQRSRGLPSYVESIPNLKMSADLIAAIYQGFVSYSSILKSRGYDSESRGCLQKAKQYQNALVSKWWNPHTNLYYTYYSDSGKFGSGEGESFLLWFNVLKDQDRISATINHINSIRWNVETTSYLPVLLYSYGHNKQAYKYLLYLSNPNTKRREYPEVSFGVIQGIVLGYMGIEPDARTNTIRTLYRSDNRGTAQINNLPVLKALINIKESERATTFKNDGHYSLNWIAVFNGKYSTIYVGNKPQKIKYKKDLKGDIQSYVEINVRPGQEITARVR
jgi:hypothetical protein